MRSLLIGTTFLFLLGSVTAYAWGGVSALLFMLLLAVLEVSLSFDNAVVNASVLSRMSVVWQNRFLSWGIPVAVFGTRFLFPLLIVAVVASLSPFEVLRLAFFDGAAYGALLSKAHIAIASFGGMFLLMVFLSFFIDHEKNIHWVRVFEHHLARLGRLESASIIGGIIALLCFSAIAGEDGWVVLQSGLVGLLSYVVMESLIGYLQKREQSMIASHAGLSLFVYLQLLDASFSLDSVKLVLCLRVLRGAVVVLPGGLDAARTPHQQRPHGRHMPRATVMCRGNAGRVKPAPLSRRILCHPFDMCRQTRIRLPLRAVPLRKPA